MRRIIAFERITPEGFFTGSNDDYRGLVVMDGDLDKDVMAEDPSVTYLFGRKTYDLMATYWPSALDDPKLTPSVRKMARSLNEDEKIVFSRTMKKASWRNTRIFPELDPDKIRKMKEGKGKDMLVLGSGSIVSQLTRHGLIDEYMLVVSPLLLGSGRPLFDGIGSRVRLELKEAKGYPSGNVLLRYSHTD